MLAFKLLILSIVGLSFSLAESSKRQELQRLKDDIITLLEKLVADATEDESSQELSGYERPSFEQILAESLEYQSQSKRRDGYVCTEGIGLHKLVIKGKTWLEAKKSCKEEGGHLAIINSEEEEELLVRMAEKSREKINKELTIYYKGQSWIGIHSLGSQWKTFSGEHLDTDEIHWGRDNMGIQQPQYVSHDKNCGMLMQDLEEVQDTGAGVQFCYQELSYICERSITSDGC